MIVYELHLVTNENRASPECHRSRADGDCFGCKEVSLRESWGAGVDVPDPPRLITDSSTQSSNLYQHPGLRHPGLRHPLLLLLQPPWGHKLISLDLCLLFLLLHFSPAHSLLSPLCFHGAGISRKMVLRSRCRYILEFSRGGCGVIPKSVSSAVQLSTSSVKDVLSHICLVFDSLSLQGVGV